MPRGPAPKPADQRRRTNKPVHEWVILAEVYAGKIPTLPGDHWTTATKRWWKAIWRTKMATQWNEGDIPALEELALLRQEFYSGAVNLANEIRLRSESFGLNPRGRQQLRWIITDEEADRAGILVDASELDTRRKERRKRITT